MSWWERRRRDRPRDPYDWFEDDFFGRGFFRPSEFLREFDESFRQMREELNRMVDKARKGELKSPEEGGPYVYGWSVRMGPDGVPHVEEFGNTMGLEEGLHPGLPGGREPLIDVVESDKQIKVTAELPGVEKNEIDLETTENDLTIRVDTGKRKYYKKVDLPAPVRADSASAMYNNGVLEVTLEKESPDRKGKKVQIG